uniref:Mobile element protein n=1 Tax=uncultured Armatimonadetes bacterium TaxID=157466 RepID=A0A6J4JJS9_9BACT|nr:Mobile element protein [uncultured Armatimonadetes bacterium]
MQVRQQSKQDLAAALQGRYVKAGKREKGELLDEFVAVTGYHRRHAVRLLRHGRFPDPRLAALRGTVAGVAAARRRGGRPRAYSPVVVGVLRVVAEASDWLCGKRLAPFLPVLVPRLEAEGALDLSRLTREERVLLVSMSPATIDRRLAPFKLRRGGRGWGTTKPGSLLKGQVPIQTYTPWEDQRPGFCEIDLVAHCGTSTAGHYLNTLTVTDVATAWTECAAVYGKSQRNVFAALEAVRERLPFPLLGIDSDNGSEFLNEHLVRFCAREQITFTRGRPYWKNDQAHVEQKNWSVVRRLVGYGRYESEAALAQLNRVYDELRPWTNCWQPTLKLIAKVRDDATGKSKKTYDQAQTPYQRVLATGAGAPEARAALAETFAAVGPAERRRRVATAVDHLLRLQERGNEIFKLANAG